MGTRKMLIDDMDGNLAKDTIRFSFDGTRYEMDLSAENIDAFSSALDPYIAAARIVGKSEKKSIAVDKEKLNEIRAWARENGYTVSDRGRIPAAVQVAFDTAESAPVVAVS